MSARVLSQAALLRQVQRLTAKLRAAKDAWQLTPEGRAGHVATYAHRVAIMHAARKYASREWPEWQVLLAVRLREVDVREYVEHGRPVVARPTPEAALRLVAEWSQAAGLDVPPTVGA